MIPLSRVVEPGEDNRVGDAPDKLGTQLLADAHQYRAFDRSEWHALHAHGFRGSNVAGAGDVKAVQVEDFTRRECDPRILEYLQKQIEEQWVRLFDLVEEQRAARCPTQRTAEQARIAGIFTN